MKSITTLPILGHSKTNNMIKSITKFPIIVLYLNMFPDFDIKLYILITIIYVYTTHTNRSRILNVSLFLCQYRNTRAVVNYTISFTRKFKSNITTFDFSNK